MRDGGRRRVCVIGAGISGLVTAKVLSEDGFDVVVFEKEPTFGGVWAASRTYPGLRTNNPRDTYVFSDHPHSSTTEDFPTAAQMRAYLQCYADRFDITPRVCTGTEVVQVESACGDDGTITGWRVTVRSADEPARVEDFDFVVVCNGVFCEPRMPALDGETRFAGRILHSSQCADLALVRGKRIIVVGGSKSAADCATWAAREGQSCMLVFRQPYWMFPRYFFGAINIQWFMFSRFSQSLLKYYRQSRPEVLLHGPLRPLVRLWWWAFSTLLRCQLRIPPPLLPEAPLPRTIETSGIGADVYRLIRQGRIQTRNTTLRRFPGGKAVEVESGEILEADLVIFATGYRQTVSFLEEDVRGQIEREQGFHLYRLILPPAIPRLGFVGYNSSTACSLTSEIAAHWLSQCFRGELSLPSLRDMEEDIACFRQWAADTMPSRSGGFFLGPHVIHYVDDLMRDMRLPPRRAHNFVAEYLLPVWPSRYRTVAEERRHTRPAQPVAANALRRKRPSA